MTTPVTSSELDAVAADAARVVPEKRKKRKAYGKTAKKGAAWSIIRQGGHELIAIPASMITARVLSPSDFGIAAAASFFVLLASRLTQFGFGAALVRIKDLRPEHTSSVFAVSISFGVGSYLALLLAAPFIGHFFRSPEAGSLLPIAALTFLFSPLGTVSGALLSRNMQFRSQAVADWADIIVGSVVTVVLALRGWGFWSIPYGHVTSVIVRVLVQLYLSGWVPSVRFSRAALNDVLSFGIGVQAKRVLEFASFNVDNLIVGRVLGMNALGLYDKAFVTMNRVVTRLTLGQAPFRIFAIIHEDQERFRRAYSRLILAITLLAYPAFAACIVVAEPLFLVLYGEKWLPAVLPFQLLCAGGMLKLLNAYASQANEAAGRIWSQVYRQAVGAVLVAVGATVGSYYAGVAGAALGVAGAMVLLTIAMQALVRHATGLSWRGMLMPQMPGIVCALTLAAVMFAAGVAMRALTPSPAPWLDLLVRLMVGGLFYAGFVLFSPFAAVRDVVRETADDLVPAPGLHFINRLGRLRGASSTS